MDLKVQRFKLRNLGFALLLNMTLGLILCMVPWDKMALTGMRFNSAIAPYRYLVGMLSAAMALIASRTEKGHFLLLIGLIASLIASIVLAYMEHFNTVDSLVDLNLFLQGIIIISLVQIKTYQKRWENILSMPPNALDLRVAGKRELFNPMIIGPHLEMNTEILNIVNHFLHTSTQTAPLVLSIHTIEPISEHLQQVAREAFRLYYQDEEREIRHYIQSRYSRSVWMIVISIAAFRFLSGWSDEFTTSTLWEILGSFAAFSLWKVGDTLFEHSEGIKKLTRVLIAKTADIEFL